MCDGSSVWFSTMGFRRLLSDGAFLPEIVQLPGRIRRGVVIRTSSALRRKTSARINAANQKQKGHAVSMLHWRGSSLNAQKVR